MDLSYAAEVYYEELLAFRRAIGTAEAWAYRHVVGINGGPSTQHLNHPPELSAHHETPKIAQKPSIARQPTQGLLHKIWPKVKLTPSIEVGFRALDKYLPANVVMTSGLRSDADQERIINEYYASHGGPEEVTDVEQRRQWLQSDGLIIAKVGSSPHRTGLAFDLSGAPIEKIKEAVDRAAADHLELFPLKNTIVERKQNCLHVNLLK